ncbi:MAG: hypothetical protein HC806_08780 [Anaerolineae bacterium]|nr:hypothetical protein [Anaerolineae bacterium]
MDKTHSKNESGQVLVILVLVIVGLLAFTALAIDGGLLLADRRGAQNAGDAAVLAGGYRLANTLEDYDQGYNVNYLNWDCVPVNDIRDKYAIPEAAQQAAKNDYPITNTINLNSSITILCEAGRIWEVISISMWTLQQTLPLESIQPLRILHLMVPYKIV